MLTCQLKEESELFRNEYEKTILNGMCRAYTLLTTILFYYMQRTKHCEHLRLIITRGIGVCSPDVRDGVLKRTIVRPCTSPMKILNYITELIIQLSITQYIIHKITSPLLNQLFHVKLKYCCRSFKVQNMQQQNELYSMNI